MTAGKITLNLSPAKQTELEQRAAAAGTDVASLILNAVDRQLEESSGESREGPCYDVWCEEFRRWVAGHRSRNPRFDDHRDSIYD